MWIWVCISVGEVEEVIGASVCAGVSVYACVSLSEIECHVCSWVCGEFDCVGDSESGVWCGVPGPVNV